MCIETEPFDPSEFFVSEESKIELVTDAFESGNQKYIINALTVVAKAEERKQEESAS